MNLRRILLAGWLHAVLVTAWLLRLNAAEPVSFSRQIAPVLQKKCLGCHNVEKSKGHFLVTSYADLLKPGSSKKPPITPGDPSKSHLLTLLKEKDPDDRMPQKDDPLPPDMIALIQEWIQSGATFDGKDSALPLGMIIPRLKPAPPPAAYPHPVPIAAIAFAPGETNIFTGGFRELLKWDARTGALIERISGMPEVISSIALNSNLPGVVAIAGGKPGQWGEVLLVNFAHPDQITLLAAASEIFLTLSLTDDGSKLAAGGGDNSIRLFDLAQKREIRKIEQHADWVVSVQFNHAGTQLLSASRDRSARLYEVASGQLLTSFMNHEAPVLAAVFLSDGKRAASVGRDRQIRLWTLDEGKESGKSESFDEEVTRLLSLKEELAAGFTDGSVRFFSVAKKEMTGRLDLFHDWVSSLEASATGNSFAAASHDGMVQIMNLPDKSKSAGFRAAPGFTAITAKP